MSSRRAVLLLCVLLAGCGHSTSGPSFTPPPLFGGGGEGRNGTVSGTLIEHDSGAPIAGTTLLLAGAVAVTNSKGEFTFTEAPTSGIAVVTAAPTGFLRRAIPVNLAASRTGIVVDAIRDSAPFSLEFYREWARNSYEGGSLQTLKPWTMNPSFYFNVITVTSGLRVPDATIARISEIFRTSVIELSAGKLQVAAFESGTEERPETEGWVNVIFYQTLPGGSLGTSTVGGNSGTISLRFDPTVQSNVNTNPYNCESVIVAVADHEITHTMGFWHTQNVLVDSFSGPGCPGVGRPALALYHSSVVYSRVPGNRDPDSDPDSAARILAPVSGPRTVLSCFRGSW